MFKYSVYLKILFITYYNNTMIIHFIETRLQNTIGTIIKIQMAWLTGWQVILVILNRAHRGGLANRAHRGGMANRAHRGGMANRAHRGGMANRARS